MLIFWRVRCLDRTDKQFKDRDLFLNTANLDPAMRAAIELEIESKTHATERKLLKFRSLFEEGITRDKVDLHEMKSFCLTSYFEDETGKEITLDEMGPILTGNPSALLIPSGTKQHDLDYLLAAKTPLPIASVSLSVEEVRLLGYFVRDVRELEDSALMREGPGSLSDGGAAVVGNRDYHVSTAVNDDEIRSFATIFRRLYMENEPCNFQKAVELFALKLVSHPRGKWASGAAEEYKTHLQAQPGFAPLLQGMTVTFNVKRLIDVFIYTQYAHQPDERRQRQFTQCLNELGGKRNLLTWLFFLELSNCGWRFCNVGRVIADWFQQFCAHHQIVPDVLNSLRSVHTGLGSDEKGEARNARLFRERVEELELQLWKQANKPEGGPVQFRLQAQEQLKRALNGEEQP